MREWDVRFARIRERVGGKLTVDQAENRPGASEDATGMEGAGDGLEEMVCRPMAGERMNGGGFFAMFRKRGPMEMVKPVKPVPVENATVTEEVVAENEAVTVKAEAAVEIETPLEAQAEAVVETETPLEAEASAEDADSVTGKIPESEKPTDVPV